MKASSSPVVPMVNIAFAENASSTTTAMIEMLLSRLMTPSVPVVVSAVICTSRVSASVLEASCVTNRFHWPSS